MESLEKIAVDLRRARQALLNENVVIDERFAQGARALDECGAEIVRLEAELAECRAGSPTDPTDPTDPDPPIIDPPPSSGERPGEDMDWGVRQRPTEFDWIARGGVLKSQHGLPDVLLDGSHGCGTAYRLSRDAGHVDRPIVYGVWDDAKDANVGGKYGSLSNPSWKNLVWSGEADASATFVGLTPFAEVGLSWGYNGGSTVPTKSVEAYDIGIRATAGGVYVTRANGHDRPGDAATKFFQLDGTWWLGYIDPDTGVTQTSYLTGLHFDDTDVAVMRNMLWRGKQPHNLGIDFKEHSDAYGKSVFTSLLFEHNDCRGGNRSALQIRPTFGSNATPTGAIMLRGNYGDDIGGNHGNPSGGAVLSVWISLNGLYCYDNDFDNFRYKALSFGGQPAWKNYPTSATGLASGNQHDKIYIGGNTCIPGPITERGTVGVSATDYLRLYGDNYFEGFVTTDTRTNSRYNDLRNGKVELYTKSGAPDWTLSKYDYDAGATRSWTDEEVADSLVRY